MIPENNEDEFAKREDQARELLAPLQNLNTPPGLRDQLRRVTTASVQQEDHASYRQPVPRRRSVWTRKIAVPLPLAALFILAFASLIGHSVVQTFSKTPPERAMPPTQITAATTVHPMPQAQQQTSNQSDQAGDCVPQTWREETVIAGLGRIATRTYISCERIEP